MRKLGAFYRSLAATVALGLAAHGRVAAGEDESEKPTDKRSFMGRWWNDAPKKVATDRPDAKEAKARQDTEAEKAQQARKREEFLRAKAAFLRRDKVLDRLLEFAHESNDRELQRRVELLSERTRALFEKKSALDNEERGAVADVAPARRTAAQKPGTTSPRKGEEP